MPNKNNVMKLPAQSERHLAKSITLEQYAQSVETLMNFAQKDCGGSCVCAQVLLSTYNGSEFQLDIVDLNRLDEKLYSHALVVIRGRIELNIEPQMTFANEDKRFEKLWAQWRHYHVKCRWRGER